MSPLSALTARELASRLRTPTGGIVLVGFLLLAGLYWLVGVDAYVARREDVVLQPWAAAQTNVIEHLLGPWAGNLAILLLVVGPAITMDSFTGDLRSGRRELLAASPLTAVQLVMAKFLGGFGYLALLLLATLWMPLTLSPWVSWDLGGLASAYLGLLLLAAAVAAVGTLCSAMAQHPLVALFSTIAAVLCLWVVGFVDRDPTSLAGQLSLSGHLQDLLRGAVRASDVSYFLLLTGWSLVACWQRVVAWRYA